MKTKSLLVAATLFFGAAATTQAQINPTAPQTGGTMNQTTVPAAPPVNPGTIDQRTPTTTNPTQMGTGTIDQRNTVPMGTNVPSQMGTGVGTVDRPVMERSTTIEERTAPVRRKATTTKQRTETMTTRP
ncbi:hypothetical protein J0X19_06460 [Hymenobacter sp. BT186]|uniref:Uncharacterized protein n=1 Tax=Hymenobacter telluris TaxID=2816474 RepID=A0A939JCR9_9BACT|nr:hypothetical protein [Hymenobacter telluris]MBO0357582.1 hypothetical protein [Hymenobacter telluris]MBW3373608.1 hypothetical protein [Hymenobacter norwichensis]